MAHDPTIRRDSGLTRRAFLGAGGALLGSTLLMGPNPFPRESALTRYAAHMKGPRVPLAYLVGSEGATVSEARELLAAGGTRAVPAASLRSGGASTSRDAMAQVRIDGTALGLSSDHDVKGAQLDALLEAVGAPDDAAVVPFYAWTYNGAGVQQARHVQFKVPFERQPTVGFALRTRGETGRGAAHSWTEAHAVLTGGADRGLPKLREGVYLLGLEQGSYRTPVTLPPASDPAWANAPSLMLTVHAI